MRAAILLLLAGCAAPQLPPEPPIMVTKLREPEETTERRADRETCIAPAARARIADCSVVRVVTSAEVTATLDASTLTSWVCAHPDDAAATFRLARLHAEHRRFEEATFFFGRVSDQVSFDDELGPTAALGWLESLNVLVELGRTECIDEVDAKIRGIRDRFCDFGLVGRHPERTKACTFIGRINADLDLMRAREGIY